MTHPKSVLTKDRKRGGQQQSSLKNLAGRPFLRSQRSSRQACYRTHWPNFEQEGLYDLSSTFWEMATSTYFLGTEIHKVQESWASWKDLKATNQSAMSSPKDICFFQMVSSTESPKIMGLKGSIPLRPYNGGLD